MENPKGSWLLWQRHGAKQTWLFGGKLGVFPLKRQASVTAGLQRWSPHSFRMSDGCICDKATHANGTQGSFATPSQGSLRSPAPKKLPPWSSHNLFPGVFFLHTSIIDISLVAKASKWVMTIVILICSHWSYSSTIINPKLPISGPFPGQL